MCRFIQTLFHKRQMIKVPDRLGAGTEVETMPLTDLPTGANPVEITRKPLQIISASAQSVGLVRSHNEDTLFSLSAVRADGVDDMIYGVFIVADGMGGHDHGEEASRAAVQAAANYLITRTYPRFLGTALEGEGESESLQEVMANAIKASQRAVLSDAPGGGTTLTIAFVFGDLVTIGHVGDSRAYAMNGSGLAHPITRDHSFVQRLVELQEITEEEARTHPNRNMLLKAVGQVETLDPDIFTFPLTRPGLLILCSDGLWGQVSDSVITSTILERRTCEEACHKLVDLANEAGGPDNISVILVDFPE